MRRILFFILIALVILAIGIFIQSKRPRPRLTQPEISVLPETKAPPRTKTVEIFLADFSTPSPHLVPVKAEVDATSPLASAINLLINPPKEWGLSSPIPPGTKLLSASLKGDTAYLNFSKELKSHFPGGSLTELLLLNSIANTACSASGAKAVQILIEGQRVDSIGGHLDASLPILPSEEFVVRK